ncbi:MAG: methylated-DNA--[protein]-cysteine S-methyltransferase [Pseudomonadaceae bacterium]|nr:methylated-DNA--[protein]-cysteine S-methyltransferase [Pseudomonadaceae bacterium]
MTSKPDALQVVYWAATPLGEMWGEVADGRLAGLHWGRPPAGARVQALPVASVMLNSYFKKSLHLTDYKSFNMTGTPFRQRVWKALCDIPFGQTISYGELAARVKSSPRAVGGAVGANPLPILVPCHRVVGKNGSLTGFSAPGGLETKRWLLRHEGVTV